jgi:hypothetical protein
VVNKSLSYFSLHSSYMYGFCDRTGLAVWGVTFIVALKMSRPSTAKSNPDLLRSPSQSAESGKLSLLLEDDHFLRKWSGPFLLGPLIPAIFSLLTIVSGHLVLNTWTGYCGYSLDSTFPLLSLSPFHFLICPPLRLCQCRPFYLLHLSPRLCLVILW